MGAASGPPLQNEALWRARLTQGQRVFPVLRWLMRHVPGQPRCKHCYAPFGGLAGKAIGLIRLGPSRKHPSICAL